jgi:hypothetical protein
MKKLKKIIVIDGKEWILNIFIEKRRSVRASFVNNGINIRLPQHLSTEEKNKSGKEMLDWAVEKIKAEPKKYEGRKFSHGDEISAFGRRYIIHVWHRVSEKNFVKINGDIVEFRLAEHHHEDIKQKYMRGKIRKILEENHLNEITQEVHLINNTYFKKKIGEISIKHTTSRWGQCFVNNGNIDFSTRLLLAPLPVIRYVIIHELAHLIYADHSKRFWNTVALVDPNYKDKVRWLKKYGHTLTL